MIILDFRLIIYRLKHRQMGMGNDLGAKQCDVIILFLINPLAWLSFRTGNG